MTRLLLALMAAGLSAQEIPLFTKDFPPEEFAARRKAVYEAIGPNAVAVLQGAPAPAGYVRFRQTNEFYYLCGVEAPHAYLLLNGATKRAALYLPHRDERAEATGGKVLSAEMAEEVRKLSGVESVGPPEQLARDLARAGWPSRGARELYTPLAPAEGLAVSRDVGFGTNSEAYNDPWDGRPSREGRFVQLLRERYPQFEVKDLSPVLDRLRLIKSEREITLIEKATKLAGLSMIEGMRSTAPGQSEHELDGVAKFIYFRNGAQGEAYNSLVASGQNAWYPHYSAGKRRMDSGDLVLMDFAPDVGYYMSDVTRQWPVNGKFSAWQRELYGFYVACYEEMLKAIRPGVPVKQIKQESGEAMGKILAGMTFSKPEYEKAAKRFVAAWQMSPGLGHSVGMATHDVGSLGDELKPGMVFTIEPALTVPEEKIYIRLEDLIVVTEKGIRAPSGFVPRSIEAVEAEMKKPGLLKTYPRVD
ncbi:MAG: aminopeptidase P family protein [Candidatus Solibacter usitatus]|nr:aminopeptidase P family protein [Candidatus Solibacter usitatus]